MSTLTIRLSESLMDARPQRDYLNQRADRARHTAERASLTPQQMLRALLDLTSETKLAPADH